jgi:pyruvate dehydrogenase E2 component (dihydrolipoamide acetyltransferase)
MPVLNMPRLSDSMEEGTIVHWLVEEGAVVELAQELVEIETDKATMTYESEFGGVLQRLAAEGETVAVGQPIAEIRAAGASPAVDAGAGNGAAPRDVHTGDRPKATPLARRIATGSGLDLATVQGTGPFGRIIAADVRAASLGLDDPAPPHTARSVVIAAAETPQPAEPVPSGEADIAGREVTREPLSRTQTLIAHRMEQAKATMPEFTVRMDVDMDGCVELRNRLKEVSADSAAPSFNDMIIKACALALRRHPRVNGAYRDGSFELYAQINIGIVVATENSLLVPTIRDADTRSLGTIAKQAAGLVRRARAGQLTPPELAGGTFTISNLGMYGVSSFTAVLNPPQAAILAVGTVEQRPVVRDGAVVAAHRMTVTLTCDHRIVYGADAAAFLADVRQELERPLRLAL